MITKGIQFKNFREKKFSKNIKKSLELLLKQNNSIIKSLKNTYKDSYKLKNIKKFKNISNIRIIGMGGSSLGTQAIYDFEKIKKYLLLKI